MGIEYGINSVKNFRLFGFATGAYQCICKKCLKEFIGDKYAITCLHCAIQKAEKSNVKTQAYSTIPQNATNLEVFSVKESEDSYSGLQAYIGFYVNNDFGFIQIPFVDHPLNCYHKKGE